MFARNGKGAETTCNSNMWQRLTLLIHSLLDGKGHGSSTGIEGETHLLVTHMHSVFGPLLMLSLIQLVSDVKERNSKQE